MYWSVCYVWLSACTSPLQTSFDDYIGDFAAIVDHAQVVLQHKEMSAAAGSFLTCEGDPVPALSFVAARCRHPILRRKALQLLRRVPQQDGLWSSVAAPFLIEQIIAVEEGDEHFSIYPASSSLPNLPPEERRIHHVAIVKGGTFEGRRRLKVQLTKAAVDPDGSLRMVHEEFWVEERPENLSWTSAWHFLCKQDLALSERSLSVASDQTTHSETSCQEHPKVPPLGTHLVLTSKGYGLT